MKTTIVIMVTESTLSIEMIEIGDNDNNKMVMINVTPIIRMLIKGIQ